MTTSRPGRRLSAVGIAVVVSLLAGCITAPASSPSPTPTGWTEHGPITLAIGEDPAGVWTQVLGEWNASHPNEQVTLRELPADAGRRHDAIAQVERAKSGELSVIAVDPTWVSEFADAGWLEKLPPSSFPTSGLLPARVTDGTRAGELYTYPTSVDPGVLYYRADLLRTAGLKPPTTWSELAAVCAKVLPTVSGLSCYGAALASAESLTDNVAEAIASAGGSLVDASGAPVVDSTNAALGLRWLAGGVKDGSIPAEALNWTPDAARQAFDAGHLLFLRDVGSARPVLRGTVADRLGVAQLPGRSGTGTPVAGGIGLGISPWSRNQATAADFIRWVGSEPVQRELLAKGSLAPARADLYDDTSLFASVPHFWVLSAAVRASAPLPATVKYPQLSQAIQAAAHPVLKGTSDAADALTDLQAKLTDLLK